MKECGGTDQPPPGTYDTYFTMKNAKGVDGMVLNLESVKAHEKFLIDLNCLHKSYGGTQKVPQRVFTKDS